MVASDSYLVVSQASMAIQRVNETLGCPQPVGEAVRCHQVALAQPASELVMEILRSIHETKTIVKGIVINKANFLMLAYYLAELRPLLEYLSSDQKLLKTEATRVTLRQLANVAQAVCSFIKRCTTGSRIYLLYHCSDLVEEIRKLVADLKAALFFSPDLASQEFMDVVIDLRNKLGEAVFFPEPGHEDMANDIATGLSEHYSGERYSTALLRSIANHLQIPLSAAAELKLELQDALETAERERKTAEVQELRELCDLLSHAAVLADVRRLASEDSPFYRSGSGNIPSSFFCPITGQIMQEPYMLVAAGYTYERAAILEWFARGHRTCPDTGEELDSMELVENRNLRQAMDEYFEHMIQEKLFDAIEKIRARGSDSEIEDAVATIKSQIDTNAQYKRHLVEMEGLQPLVDILKPAAQVLREKILRILCGVAVSGEEFKVHLINAGVVPVLLRMLTKSPTETSGVVQLLFELSKVEAGRQTMLKVTGCVFSIASACSLCTQDEKEMAEKLLDNLCEKNPQVVIQVAGAGVFKPLVNNLGPGMDIVTRIHMAMAVVDLNLNEHGSAKLVSTGGVPPLLDLLKNGTMGGQVAALKALKHLSGIDRNKVTIARAGAIPVLVSFLASDETDVRIEALATLSYLATDRQGAIEIDQVGAITRLLGMLRYGESLVREYALKTLQCMVKVSRTVRMTVRESGGVPYFFSLLQSGQIAPTCQGSILSLLCHIIEDGESRDNVEPSRSDLQFLIRLFEQLSEPKEKVSILGIIKNSRVQTLVGGDHNLFTMLIKCLEPGSSQLQEFAAATLSKLADTRQVEVGTQLALARLGMIPPMVNLLSWGTEKARQHAALTLGLLSMSTPQLTVRQSAIKTLLAKLGIQRYKCCKVHIGKCSQRGTLCLVESGAIPVLIRLVRDGGHRGVECSVEALLTLVDPPENMEKGVDFLMKNNVLEPVVSLIGRSQNSTEKGVRMLERIFRFQKYREEKYSAVAKSSLCTTMTIGTTEARKAAATALMHLDMMPKGSTYTL